MRSRPRSSNSQIHPSVGACICALVLSLALPAQAETLPSAQEKFSQRLQFNALIEAEQAKAKSELMEDLQAQKTWSLDTSVSYGHDDNVTLDSKRVGDLFHNETVELDTHFEHEGFAGLVGPGYYGVNAYTEYTGYFELEEFDNHIMSVSPYVEFDLFEDIAFRLNYDFSLIRYIHDNQLDYSAHSLTPSLTYSFSEHFTHELYYRYEYSDYRDRKQLSASNLFIEEERNDRLNEMGYGIHWFPTDQSYFRATASYLENDSNDTYLAFNDFDAWRISGFYHQEVFGPFSFVATGGYHYKDYDLRVFKSGSSIAQQDDFFYMGAYLYYRLSEQTKILVSYLYSQNDSNDPLQEYSNSVLSAGIQVKL